MLPEPDFQLAVAGSMQPPAFQDMQPSRAVAVEGGFDVAGLGCSGCTPRSWAENLALLGALLKALLRVGCAVFTGLTPLRLVV